MRADPEQYSLAEYEEFFEQRRRRALRLAYVLCGNASEAEDIVAESFAKMYIAWSKGQIDDPVSYLRRIITNQVRSQ